MKKFIRLFSAALALLLLGSVLFGCDLSGTTTETGTEGGTEPAESTATAGTAEWKINGTALKDYTVVYNKDAASYGKEAFDYLNKKAQELSGLTLTGKTETGDGAEILLATDGGDATVADAFKKNPDGLIGVSGKKIVLLGCNYGALRQVIDTLFAKAGETCEINVTGCEAVAVKKASLTVMTYNVQQDLKKEGRRSDCVDEMIATVKTQSPDVFGTQEDTTEINKLFLAGLPDYSSYHGATYQDSTGLGDIVYWKTSRFTVIKKGYMFMSDTPGSKSKFEGSNAYRGFTYLIFEEKDTGNQFLFINLHADYRAEEEVRVAQLQVLTAQLKKINKNNLPVVILGDFNATPKKASILTFLRDNPTFGMTREIAKSKGDNGGTLIVSEFTTRDHDYVFDYIFVSTDSVNTTYYSVIPNVKNGKYPSDHLPVVAKIDIY